MADVTEGEKPKAEAPEAAQMKRVSYSGVTKALGNREVEVVISTESEDRDKDIVIAAGIGLANYNRNPIVLFQHNPSKPVARTIQLTLMQGQMVARAQFPEAGMVEDADEVYGLIKAEIINAASVGFIPKEWEPRDKERPWGGQLYKKCDLLEWSFVSIPANPEAIIIGRSLETVAVGKFFSWAGESGLAFGQVKSAGENEIALTVWEMTDAGYVPSETTKVFAAGEAATALAPFKGFAEPEKSADDSPCAGAALTGIADSRLRAIKALRLWLV